MSNEEITNTVEHILSELKKSKSYIKNKIDNKIGVTHENEKNHKKYKNILACINQKIYFYENFDTLEKCDVKNTEREDFIRNSNKISKKNINFFEEFKKNEKEFDLNRLKKKTVFGHTIEGNAIIINNENFVKLFKYCEQYNYSSTHLNKNAKHNSKNFMHKKNQIGKESERNTEKGEDKREMEEESEEVEDNYLSEQSCSSSSIISINTFAKKQRMLRIAKNRKEYIKHKYDDNSYINHKIERCSDCSSSSFSWYDKEYDELFYYSNLLKEDKHLRKSNFNFSNTIKKKHSPFYNYIYFKYLENDKSKLYPVFINYIKGKKKLCNLKKINKYHKNCQNQINKYELNSNLFNYKDCKYLCSVEKNAKEKNQTFKIIESIETLKKYNFDKDEINYSIDKMIHQIENLSNLENGYNRKITFNDNFSSFVKRNKDYLQKENNFAFKNLCDTDKIKLKVKIVGTDGKIIKNRCLDNVVINKNKSFGYLAHKLGHSFKLTGDQIKNIKIFFDGDLCDKNMTFDNSELGLEDGYQIDVKFPLIDDVTCALDESAFSDDSYILFLPDSYVIE